MFSEAKWITLTNKRLDDVNHFLFRKTFDTVKTDGAKISIAAKDFFFLYVNGFLIARGSLPKFEEMNCYTFNIEDYLFEGENTVAIHTVSLKGKNGVIAEIKVGNETVCITDETWSCAKHTGYEFDRRSDTPLFSETYDARSEEIEFELNFYDDSGWYEALIMGNPPSVKVALSPSFKSPVKPIAIKSDKNKLIIDFGKISSGRLFLCAYGKRGGVAVINYFNDINNQSCPYSDAFVFSGSDEDMLKLTFEREFRFAEILLPEGATVIPDGICIL